jgi:PAS domain S-box-containing protein
VQIVRSRRHARKLKCAPAALPRTVLSSLGITSAVIAVAPAMAQQSVGAAGPVLSFWSSPPIPWLILTLVGLVLAAMAWWRCRAAISSNRELRQAAAEREHSERAQRCSENRFQDAAEAGSDWIWETDAELRFSWISPQVEAVCQQPSSFFIGKSSETLGPPTADLEAWREHLEDLKARRAFRDYHISRILSDGRVVHMAVSGKPRFDADGAFKGYVGTGRDLTAEV